MGNDVISPILVDILKKIHYDTHGKKRKERSQAVFFVGTVERERDGQSYSISYAINAKPKRGN
jgi:hypothetical protein